MTGTKMNYYADFEKGVLGNVSVVNCTYSEEVNYIIVIKKSHFYF